MRKRKEVTGTGHRGRRPGPAVSACLACREGFAAPAPVPDPLRGGVSATTAICGAARPAGVRWLRPGWSPGLGTCGSRPRQPSGTVLRQCFGRPGHVMGC